MTSNANAISWEQQLLRLAYTALDNHALPNQIRVDQTVLEQAYQYCTTMTRQHSRTFYLASALLPAAVRPAIRALYAFCRVSDDIVDHNQGNREQILADWQRQCSSPITSSNHNDISDLVALAWNDAKATHHIPSQYATQLLDGISQDLTISRYQTFADLAHYCYGVASTVGLMVMHMIGYKNKSAIPFAIKLGVALQLTNILRDIGEDWAIGRLYLPQDELAAFNLTEADIERGQVTDNWRAFMRFQIDRARRLYNEALPGVALLDPAGRFAIAAAAELYQGILNDIEAHDFDVFNRRAHLNSRQKWQRLPGIWWRTATNAYTRGADLPQPNRLTTSPAE
jgi:phytoene synthase